ncbi:3'-5' exoribonuclease CSL4 [Aphelenchoides avenae]|nr:3'-5' exoribonuclease CSL4 [Aphelenchus avenae]
MTSLLLDQSILPGCSSNSAQRTCIPGEKLFPSSGGYRAGNGCYEIHNAIYASLIGFVHTFSMKDFDGREQKVVEVRRAFDEKHHVVPYAGCIVTARVEAISLKFAKCSIICVEDTLLNHEFNSTLRKEDIRATEKDKIELYKCVQPGDIILARVLGFGDAQTAFLLSIAENALGVIHAVGQNGKRLLPESSEVVKDPNTEYREPRKVAVVPALNKDK